MRRFLGLLLVLLLPAASPAQPLTVVRVLDSTTFLLSSGQRVQLTPTEYRLHTLMHDPVYRLGVAWQNVSYNQPAHTGFYLGHGMKLPPKPNITTDRAR